METVRAAARACAYAVIATGMLLGVPAIGLAQGAPTSPLQSQTLPLTSAARQLGKKGVFLSFSYIQNILANVSGGRKTGTLPSGEFTMGADFDLQKLMRIPGGSFHITLDERNGKTISSAAGTNFGLAADYGPDDATRLSEFYYRQAIAHDRIDIKLGRTNPTLDFATSGISCDFVSNLFCAQPGTWYFMSGENPYPTSTWGGRVNVQVMDHVYVRAGGYEDDPSQFTGQGFTWRWDTGTGAFIPFEIGYHTKRAKYDVGGYYDTGPYTPPTPNYTRHGRTAFYVQGQQAVWEAGGASRQKLTVFGGALVQAGGYAPYWGEYYGGLFVNAPWPTRPHDTAGLAIAYMPLAGAASPFSREYLLELNYGVQVTPGIVVKPMMEYVIHPDEIGFDNPTRVGNAFVIGAQLSINLGDMFHFPQFIAY